MTVSPILFYALLWAFLLCVVGAWFFSSKLADTQRQLDNVRRCNRHNFNRYNGHLDFLYDEICNRCMLRHKDLPIATIAVYSRVKDLWDEYPELSANDFPIAHTPAHDNMRNTVGVCYWKRDKHELDSPELALMWAAGIIP